MPLWHVLDALGSPVSARPLPCMHVSLLSLRGRISHCFMIFDLPFTSGTLRVSLTYRRCLKRMLIHQSFFINDSIIISKVTIQNIKYYNTTQYKILLLFILLSATSLRPQTDLVSNMLRILFNTNNKKNFSN